MISTENLENLFQNMNRHINIDKDREVYTKHYNKLRDELFGHLKTINAAFKILMKGHQLGGSYGDNLKVNKPDEFDLVFFLSLPESRSIIVRKDTKMPGNVFLDLTEVFNKIKDKPHHEVVFKLLQKLVTPRNLLIVDKLQSWLQGLVDRALKAMQHKIVVDGIPSNLRYNNSGPAHTITVRGSYNFSVDFVPAIKLSKEQSILSTKLRNDFDWEAIPKPMKPFKENNTSFRASFYTAEYNLMKDNNNLKNALRFLKKFRDTHQNMNNLKSYYIKTLFLFKLNEKDASFWRLPLSFVVFEMFTELETKLSNARLPFYWDTALNMLQPLPQVKIDEMFNCVRNARLTLLRAKHSLNDQLRSDVRNLFMNSAERNGGKVNANLSNGATAVPPVNRATAVASTNAASAAISSNASSAEVIQKRNVHK